MTRELKFRAWFPKTKRMAYFSGPHINFEYGLFALDCITKEYQGICELPDDYGEAIFSEFTGLKDKNGIEIFGGDILREDFPPHCTVEELREHDVLAIVFFDAGCFHVSRSGTRANSLMIPFFEAHLQTVVGNIYENPELLK